MDVFLVVDVIDIFKEYSWNQEQGLNHFIKDIFDNADYGILLVNVQIAYKIQIGFFCTLKSLKEVDKIVSEFDIDKFKTDLFDKFQNTSGYTINELEEEYDLTKNDLKIFLGKIVNKLKKENFFFVSGQY